MTARRFDAMVIGGGLVGSAIAWGLRREGLSVALLDEGDAAYRASRGNFGLVWVQSKGLGAPWYQRWTRQSAESWAALADDLSKQTGLSLGLSQPGGLHLCLSDQEMKDRETRLEQMKREAGNYGFDYRMLDAREAREMLPGLGPAVVGASFTPYDGHVSPLALLRGLHHGFTALDGVYLPNVKITGIATAPRNFLLETNLGTIQAERAVLAAGLGNAALASHFGLKAPVRPQRGQVLVTERTRAALPMPTTTIRQTGEGTIMLGDSVEEVGFDTRQSQPVMAEIAHRAALCFPWIGKLNVVRAWSALRVMSPDGLPIYEQSETLRGAFTANCHSGVTLAAAHGKLLAPMIARGELDPFLAPFSAKRF